MVTDPIHVLTGSDPAFYPPTVRATRHILSFVKWRFSLAPVGTYHWEPADDTPDQKGSEIFIGSDTPITTQYVGKRPAITVMRSQAAFQGIGQGDVLSADLRTGGRTYMDLIPTTIVIHVLSRIPVVAERLAWFVQNEIFTLRAEIVKTEPCILYLGARTGMSPPSPAGTLVDTPEPGWTCVTLALPTFLQHASEKSPLNKKIVKGMNPVIRPR